MLPKVHRLWHPQDFKAVYARGVHRKTSHLTLRALRCSPQPEDQISEILNQTQRATRIGISISQKVSKRAVVRNRIKRQIRAAFRQLLSKLSSGWDIVIVVKPTAIECNYAEFLQELEQLLVQAEVINEYSGGNIV
ncbi:ribonuclease P protein component [Lyngbya sp. PCC 8106]|uniref:ribonuclease P protein component n=1 Tax=Lyngbya sp. (strain PCC 8106) TaxID=313612 RepID=UPI0000EACF1C|nr:ribonuclease P protein component [Lyngbya sp. PCC 8106]EAW33840.1 ribonuclease P [Lyngbya sp. PCC 8106]